MHSSAINCRTVHLLAMRGFVSQLVHRARDERCESEHMVLTDSVGIKEYENRLRKIKYMM